MHKLCAVTQLIAFTTLSGWAHAGSAVVSDGRFTNVYVYPDPSRETWEQHLATLRPADAAQFSRAAIDGYVQTLMTPTWPSYFDSLHQYNGINPPRFFGSSVASQQCVDAALHDLHNGVMQWDTIRSLSNCHVAGHDPSPQVTLIFSPDIKIAEVKPFGTGPDMCANTRATGWHAWGLNVPNFIAMPTDPKCASDFKTFSHTLSHEIVETISDPAGTGMGTFGVHELGDNCENRGDAFTEWNSLAVARYWSNFDNDCLPKLDPPSGSDSTIWILGQGSPLQRQTGAVHELQLAIPAGRTIANGEITDLQLVIQTGDDDLRGGADNAAATLTFSGGAATTQNINGKRHWDNGETHAVHLALPAGPHPRVADLSGVTIDTHFGGGISGDNWNINKVALIVSFPSGSAVVEAPMPVTRVLLDKSGGPLIRFTGHAHDLQLDVPNLADPGLVNSLNLIISVGNDDLRGGGSAGDNCDVVVGLANGATVRVGNANGGGSWKNWTDHTVRIPIAAGSLRASDIKFISLHTGFGGGIGGDNWNVQRVQLVATIVPPVPAATPPPPAIPPPSGGPTNTLGRLAQMGVDYSVPQATLQDWLGNPQYTPYPAISAALLASGWQFKSPVFIDVIVGFYEGTRGVKSPRRVEDVRTDVLRAAVLAASNERNGTRVTTFNALLRP